MGLFDWVSVKGPNEIIQAHVDLPISLLNDSRDTGVEGVVLVERDFKSALIPIDLVDMKIPGSDSGRHDVYSSFDLFWHAAVSIFEVGGDFAEGERVSGGHKLLIEIETLCGVFNVVLRDEGLHREINTWERFKSGEWVVVGGWSFAVGVGFEELDFAVDKLAVKVVAYGVHLARLFCAEEIAGSADLEVSEGERVSGAELIELGEGLESLCSGFGEGFIGGEQKVGVSLSVRSSDSAPELIELAQAKVVSVFDNQGVSVGDIESSFDDCGADKDVDFALDESDHDGFKFGFVHLSVPDGDSGLGNEFANFVGDVINAVDSVVDEKDLSATGEFAEDSFSHDFVRGWSDESANWESSRGWVVDERHLPNVHQGHAEGARDWGCAHAEDIDIDSDGFQCFLVFDPEFLFFIDDEKAEVFEFEFL